MEGLSKEYSMDQLPTAPIGKQQVIDLNAGAILRKEKKKSLNFCGINPFLLLTFIMLVKCLALGGWLYREYQVFDFGCQMLRMGADYIYDRHKRSLELDEFLQKQSTILHKSRPISQSSQGALTTLVTMTNLQELPSNSSTPIRMKTIRQRVEEVNRVPVESDEEEPTIYLSPIQSRHAPPIDDEQMATVQQEKPKKKRKGKKKNRSTTPTPTEPPVTKKKKGLGRKKQRLLEKMRQEEEMQNRVAAEQTKSPRHLMAPVGHTRSTSRPMTFLDGAVEPQDTKRGHIRNYQMNKATKKPKNSIKLSEETKLMWKMNELNYTTHAMQVKTTEMTKEDGRGMERFIESLPVPKREREPVTTQEPMNEFYSSKATAWPRSRDKGDRERGGGTTIAPIPVIVALRPENKVREGDSFQASTQKYAPVAIYYETVIEPPRRPLDSTLAQLEREQKYRERIYPNDEESKEYFVPSEKRKVYHGFDRSRDAAINAGLDDALSHPVKSPKQRKVEDEDMNARFQDELKSFTSNALCLVRTIFDTWCGIQIITSIPYLVGMCLAKRNLFVGHLICDIFFLGGGFLFSVTLLVLSILLYVAIEGMSTAEFLQWLMFVFVIEALLILYTVVVYICYQCSERILTSCGYSKSAAEVV